MMKITDMIVQESIGRENLYAFSQSVFRTEVIKTLNCALSSVCVLLPAKAAGNNFLIMREASVRFSDI
jgi:arginine exporter protein ArgO